MRVGNIAVIAAGIGLSAALSVENLYKDVCITRFVKGPASSLPWPIC
jgi:hypothetical protein